MKSEIDFAALHATIDRLRITSTDADRIRAAYHAQLDANDPSAIFTLTAAKKRMERERAEA